MSDSRKGDFSRFPFDPRKHYSAVLMQQGRVQLDADWNAWADILNHRLRAETADLVGPGGGPAGAAGFEVLPGYGLAFDGRDDLVTIGGPRGNPAFSPAGGWTLESWVTPRKGGGIVASKTVLSSGSPVEELFLSVEPDGKVRLHRAAAAAPDPVTQDALPFDKAGHVAVVSDADGTRLYLNGRLSARDGLACPFTAGAPSAFNVGLSLDDDKPTFPFRGLIHELRFWGTARSQDDLRATSRPEDLTGQEDGLLGWWRFDQGSGTEVADRGPGGTVAVLGDGKREQRPRWVLRSLHVGPGRYYVDGLPCVNEERVSFGQQPDLPGATLPSLAGSSAACLFYLDAWERTLSALDDPGIVEVALGGADTTLRSRIVAQVKCLPVALDPASPDPSPEEVEKLPEWQSLLAAEAERGLLKARRQPNAEGAVGNLLYRVEVHGGGGIYGGSRPEDDGFAIAQIGNGSAGADVKLEQPAGFAAGQWAELFDPESPSPGVLATVKTVGSDGKSLSLTFADSSARLTGRETRVRTIATFKWSRTNGVSAWPMLALEAGSATIRLRDLGRDDFDLSPGEWVEIVDDASVLQGMVEPLLQVTAVRTETRQVTVTTAPSGRVGRNVALHPLLRRWDRDPAVSSPPGLTPVRTDWLTLESGIQVAFDGVGPCRSGDHWFLPVRSLTGNVEWPSDGANPVAKPPDGTDHHYAPLAFLVSDDEGLRRVDCRTTFQPLSTGAVSKAGDTMDGSLVVRGDVEVQGTVSAAFLLGSLDTAGAVGTRALADGAVTAAKLAAGITGVPAGASILTESPQPPAGFVATGFSMTFGSSTPSWAVRREIPRVPDGRLASVVAHGRVYTVLESGELWEYDPATNGWTTRRTMPEARQGFAAGVAGEKVYVIGGLDAQGRPAPGVYEYDPATDRWTGRSPMPTPRHRLAVASWGGVLFALGGIHNRDRATETNEAYDPSADAWTPRRHMPGPRHSFGAGTLGDRVYAVGGEGRSVFGVGRMISVHNFCYHAATDRWEHHRAPLPSPRTDHAVAVAAGRLFVIGGRALFGETAAVEAFDPAANQWTSGPPLPQPIAAPGAAGEGGTLYVLGGKTSPEARSSLVQASAVAATFWVHRRLG
jgi:hypothetical protein